MVCRDQSQARSITAATAARQLGAQLPVAVRPALAHNVDMNQPPNIQVSVATRFLDEHSTPSDGRFAFAYTITIKNQGKIAAQLISRHWIITHGSGKVEEVRGDGVVGEQPHLGPGEAFEYTSGAVLDTAVGTMQGSYQMLTEDGNAFDAIIPRFTLSVPRTLH